MKNKSDTSHLIYLNNEQDEEPLPIDLNIKEYVSKILHHLQLTIDYIEITLLSSESIQTLNHDYFKINQPTDTISFNLTPEELITGDLYLCPATIRKNANEFSTTYLTEFKLVLIHSILHLTGKNDQSEPDYLEMKQTQERILSELSHA